MSGRGVSGPGLSGLGVSGLGGNGARGRGVSGPGGCDLILVADWSARATPSPVRPSRDAIWLCADLRGARAVSYHRTRREALAAIEGWLGQGHRTLVAFDVAMGYPAGFAARLTGRAEALAVWDWLAARIEDGPRNANNRFAVAAAINGAFAGIGPLWGRPMGRAHEGLPATDARAGHGLASDRRATDRRAPGAQSVLKLAGAGSVGGQSLVALAALAGLRRRHGLRVWPQETGFAEPDAPRVLAEVYPSLHPVAGVGIRDAEQVAATDAALRAAPARWFTAPGAIPDAARVAAEEGWILGIGPDGPLAPVR